jgi:hypothetical protein
LAKVNGPDVALTFGPFPFADIQACFLRRFWSGCVIESGLDFSERRNGGPDDAAVNFLFGLLTKFDGLDERAFLAVLLD